MSVELHVFRDRDGHVRVSITAPNGSRTKSVRINDIERQALETIAAKAVGLSSLGWFDDAKEAA